MVAVKQGSCTSRQVTTNHEKALSYDCQMHASFIFLALLLLTRAAAQLSERAAMHITHQQQEGRILLNSDSRR